MSSAPDVAAQLRLRVVAAEEERDALLRLKHERGERQRAENLLDIARTRSVEKTAQLAASEAKLSAILQALPTSAAGSRAWSRPAAAGAAASLARDEEADDAGPSEDVHRFAAVADTVQVYRRCVAAAVLPVFPQTMTLDRHEQVVVFGSQDSASSGFFGALAGSDQCIDRDDLVAYVSRIWRSDVTALLVAVADDRQDGRLAAKDVVNVMRLLKHFVQCYAVCSGAAGFASCVLEQIAAEVSERAELELHETGDAKGVSLVRLRTVRVDHLPATEDGDFECCVSVHQREFTETGGDDSCDDDDDVHNDAETQGRSRWGQWGSSYKVIGRTEHRLAYPEEDGMVEFGSAGAGSRSGSGFALCHAPGTVLLKLGDHNWLHDNVEGSRAVRLENDLYGDQSVGLQRCGVPVIGADGFPTEIVYRLEPRFPSDQRSHVSRRRESARGTVCYCPSEVSQAMVSCADAIDEFKGTKPMRSLPDSMRLDGDEKHAAAELFRMAAPVVAHTQPDTRRVRTRFLHAHMAHDAAGKYPEVSAVSEVVLLLLSFSSCGDSIGASEFDQFLSLLKHYMRTYATSRVDLCDDILEPLMQSIRDERQGDGPQLSESGTQLGVSAVSVIVMAIEHPPAVEGASVLLYQKEFSQCEQLDDVVQQSGLVNGTWGCSERKVGSTEQQDFRGLSSAAFRGSTSTFECIAPGYVQLKLVGGTGLAATLTGSAWLWLELGAGRTTHSAQARLLRDDGAPLLGADGYPTCVECVVYVIPSVGDSSWNQNESWSSDGSPTIVDRRGRPQSPMHSTLRLLKQERERREEREITYRAVVALMQQQQRDAFAAAKQASDSKIAASELHVLEAQLRHETDRMQAAERALASARVVTAAKANKLQALRAATDTRQRQQKAPASNGNLRPLAAKAAKSIPGNQVAVGTTNGSLGLPPVSAAERRAETESAWKGQGVTMEGTWQASAPPERGWMRIADPPDDPAGNSVLLKVLQYNILADHLADAPDRIERYTYEQCPPYAVSWAYRLEVLLKELSGYDADVLCLQEVQKHHFEDSLCPRLREMGYDGIYAPRNTEISPEKSAAGRLPDGVAIFFRSARLELVERSEIVFGAAAAACPRHYRAGSSDVDTDAGVEEDPPPVVVLPQVGDLRRTVMSNEGGALLALLRLVGSGAQGAGPGTGVVVCGDFNSEPAVATGASGGGVYELLSTGCLPTEHADHPMAKGTVQGMGDLRCAEMRSAYAQAGWEPICTMKDHRGERCLDFVWLGGAAELIRTLRMPYGAPRGGGAAGAASGFSRIPNWQWPSDHLAIGAEIMLPMRHGDE